MKSNRRRFLKSAAITVIGTATPATWRLPAASAKSKARLWPRVDRDGMLVINGRREFLLGLYSLPNGVSPWAQAREAGFNLIHAGIESKSFRLAHQNGLYAWSS